MTTRRTPLIARLAAAVASAVITVTLLGAVVSISEPERSQLLAATQRHPSAVPAVVLAAAGTRLPAR